MLIVSARVRSKIAVVEMHGPIGAAIKSPSYERLLWDIKKDHSIKAMVMDIDSPGGSVTTSDYLYHAVAKIAETKPVIASIRGVGASGAYMISCAAHRIIANPGAIVGSIGVISIRPDLQELMQRVGVGVNVNKSGVFKDMGAFWRDPTPEEEQKIQTLIDESYRGFLAVVAKARKMDESKIRDLATGEVFWATRAKELGLVDQLGDLGTAIDLASEMAQAPRRPVFMRPRRGLRDLLLNPISEMMVESVASAIERRLWMGTPKY